LRAKLDTLMEALERRQFGTAAEFNDPRAYLPVGEIAGPMSTQ